MSQLVELLRTPLAESLAHALLQFAWQGPMIALLLAVLLYLTRDRSPNLRYAMSCGALALMALAPIATFLATYPPPPGPPIEGAAGAADERLLDVQQWLIIGWMLGVSLLLARLCCGLTQAQRWRLDAQVASQAWQRRCGELAARLGLRKTVQVVTAAHVHVPTVLGWFRPVVAFPAEVLTGLPARQLESILAHELAHIRRHDALINLLQSVVETLLFYQPAVWWVSHRIRLEREYCCDDLAIAVCGDALAYAHALTALEEQRGTTLSVAVSSAGGSLMNRIRRLFGMQALPHRMPASRALGALLLMCSMVGLSMSLSAAPSAPTASAAPTLVAHAGDCQCANCCGSHRADHADQHRKKARPNQEQAYPRHQKEDDQADQPANVPPLRPPKARRAPAAKLPPVYAPSIPQRTPPPPYQGTDGKNAWWRQPASPFQFKFDAPKQNTWQGIPQIPPVQGMKQQIPPVQGMKQRGQFAPTPPPTMKSPFKMVPPKIEWRNSFPTPTDEGASPFRFAPTPPKAEWKKFQFPSEQFKPVPFKWRFQPSPPEEGDAPKEVRPPKKASRSAIL